MKLNYIKALECFNFMMPMIPVPLYWQDIDGTVLGASKSFWDMVGVPASDSNIGKKIEDIYSQEQAEKIKQYILEVVETKQAITKEESIIDIDTDEIKWFNTTRGPVYDENDNVIGIIGTMIEITTQKFSAQMKRENNILEYLDIVMPMIPVPLYWQGVDGTVLGANKPLWDIVGAPEDYNGIGKKIEDIYPQIQALEIKEHILKVVRTKQISAREESITDISTGEIKWFNATRGPIFDNNNNVIGIIGTTVEITMQKEAEKLRLDNLRLENELQKAELVSHQKFRKLVDQLAHDLGSPLMTLSVLNNRCDALPERERLLLKNALSRIRDICGTLLSEYKPKEVVSDTETTNSTQELLVSAAIEELLMDKKYEYQHLPVKFSIEYGEASQFSFIKIDTASFKRMLSNLINNAVEAISEDSTTGQVWLELSVTVDEVRLSIVDNGSGIKRELVDKILNKENFTSNKVAGHGIGLSQVYDTLDQNNGKLEVESITGIGSKISVVFPKTITANWILSELELQINNIIVILDDDESIHNAWDLRFAEFVGLEVRHFTQGLEVVRYLNSLELVTRERVFLLSDYELLQQKMTGLDVIRDSQIKNSVLVTSHYTNEKVRVEAGDLGVKILPKQLAYILPIKCEFSKL